MGAEIRDGPLYEVASAYLRANLVRHFEAALFADVLDAVDEFAGDTFAEQRFGYGYVQCHRQLSFRCHEPSGHILGGYLEVFARHGQLPAVYFEEEAVARLDGRNPFLRK